MSFRQANPTGSWDDFRDFNQSTSFKELREHAVDDQGGLCAYCEVHHQEQVGFFSIEHFHPKSDDSNPNKNWGLDWSNMLAVCRGGREENKELYPTPENLSCDAHKDHLKQQQITLNPLTMPATKIFVFNKRTGELLVAESSDDEMKSLASETLRVLNLNCYRLCTARLEILKRYNQEIAKARKQNNVQIMQQLASRWFSKAWPSFFSTRRCLLGKHAEEYLSQIKFTG